MSPNSVRFFRGFTLSLIYFAAFYIVQLVLAKTGAFLHDVNFDRIENWDVGYYRSIAADGYDFESHNTGFFVLFPLVWRLLQLNYIAVIVFNGLAFSVGIGLLNMLYKVWNPLFLFVFLTLPSIYFNFIPYTEALYFLLGAWALYAYRQKRFWHVAIALFLLSLTRATAVFVLPALCLCELLDFAVHRSLRTFLIRIACCVLPVAMGIAIFVTYEYIQTGVWFAYHKTQASHWGHQFSWPRSPFTNIEGATVRYHWLSALAVFLGFLGGGYALYSCFRFIRTRRYEPLTLISAIYLALATASILFMNPRCGDGPTNVMGANRYILAAPFLFTFLRGLAEERARIGAVAAAAVLGHLTWQLFDAYESGTAFIRVGLLPSLEVVLFLVPLFAKQYRHAWILIAIINFSFQLAFFQHFIQPLYVD